MCGPPDFEALNTCMTRLAELSAAGLTTYAACKTASLCRQLRTKRKEQEETALRDVPAGLAGEGLSGRSST